MPPYLTICAFVLAILLFVSTGDWVAGASAPLCLALLWVGWYMPDYDEKGREIPDTFKHW